MESEEVESSTPPGSAMSSVVVADGRREKKSMETARLRYPEKVKGTGSREFGMQTRVGGNPGDRTSVARGFE